MNRTLLPPPEPQALCLSPRHICVFIQIQSTSVTLTLRNLQIFQRHAEKSSFNNRCAFIHTKAKVKVTLVQALRLCTGRTALSGSRVIALLFLDHGSRRRWGVSVTPRPLFTPGKNPLPIVQEAGWAPGPIWAGTENLAATGIRFPDRPARSQSLYRLNYRAHFYSQQCIQNYIYKFVTNLLIQIMALIWKVSRLINPNHLYLYVHLQVNNFRCFFLQKQFIFLTTCITASCTIFILWEAARRSPVFRSAVSEEPRV